MSKSHNRTFPRRLRRSRRGASAVKIILGIVTLGAMGLLGWMYVPNWYERYRASGDASNATRLTAETVKVARQDLRVTLTSSGRLRAIRSVPILPGITNRQLRITWIADEGKAVKPGDLLVKFDTAEIEEQQRQLKQSLEEATQQRTNAEAAIAIQKSDAESAVAAAEAALKSSTTELNTYRDLEAPKRVNDLDTSINENRKKLSEARQAVTEARQKLEDQLFSEEDQRKQLERALSEAQQTAVTAERILASNQLQKKIFRQYEYPQQLENKQQARRSAELAVEKAKVNAARQMEQRRAELNRYENTMKQQQRRLDQIAEELKKSTIEAPVEGLVVYGDPSRGMYYAERISVGANWYGGNVLMTIPDLSAFEIDILVPEDYRGRVTESVPAAITFEAVPGLVFSGKLKEIARIGTTAGFNYDEASAPRSFKSIVSLDGVDPRLVSGMLAKVEITADVVPQTLLVPVDALYNENGSPIAYVRHESGVGGSVRYEKRRVRTGKRNDSYVQIVEGLSEGETLSLVEPSDAVSLKPTNELTPTTLPTSQPSSQPTSQPADESTDAPGTQPAVAVDVAAPTPTTAPTSQPTSQPSKVSP